MRCVHVDAHYDMLRRCRGDADHTSGLCSKHEDDQLVMATHGLTWLVLGVAGNCAVATYYSKTERARLIEQGRHIWPASIGASLLQAFPRRLLAEVQIALLDELPVWMQRCDLQAVAR